MVAYGRRKGSRMVRNPPPLEFAAALLWVVGATACGGDSGTKGQGAPVPIPVRCVAGEAIGCVCADGTFAAQICQVDETYSACACGPGSSMGAGGSAAIGMGGAGGVSATGGTFAPEDAGATGGTGATGGASATGGATAPGDAGPLDGAIGTGGTTGTGGTGPVVPPGETPVYRVPVRVHMAASGLTNAELAPVLDEVNEIWLSQAGICFEFEVTNDETNITNGFDVRFEATSIPGAPGSNGLTQNGHLIWSLDHPSLGSAPNPVQHPAARTVAHELGHALNLDHENPPPSTDCASPCYCVTLGLDCDDFLMRSGRLGFFLADDEIQIARARAEQRGLADTAPTSCSAPVWNR